MQALHQAFLSVSPPHLIIIYSLVFFNPHSAQQMEDCNQGSFSRETPNFVDLRMFLLFKRRKMVVVRSELVSIQSRSRSDAQIILSIAALRKLLTSQRTDLAFLPVNIRSLGPLMYVTRQSSHLTITHFQIMK